MHSGGSGGFRFSVVSVEADYGASLVRAQEVGGVLERASGLLGEEGGLVEMVQREELERLAREAAGVGSGEDGEEAAEGAGKEVGAVQLATALASFIGQRHPEAKAAVEQARREAEEARLRAEEEELKKSKGKKAKKAKKEKKEETGEDAGAGGGVGGGEQAEEREEVLQAIKSAIRPTLHGAMPNCVFVLCDYPRTVEEALPLVEGAVFLPGVEEKEETRVELRGCLLLRRSGELSEEEVEEERKLQGEGEEEEEGAGEEEVGKKAKKGKKGPSAEEVAEMERKAKEKRIKEALRVKRQLAEEGRLGMLAFEKCAERESGGVWGKVGFSRVEVGEEEVQEGGKGLMVAVGVEAVKLAIDWYRFQRWQRSVHHTISIPATTAPTSTLFSTYSSLLSSSPTSLGVEGVVFGMVEAVARSVDGGEGGEGGGEGGGEVGDVVSEVERVREEVKEKVRGVVEDALTQGRRIVEMERRGRSRGEVESRREVESREIQPPPSPPSSPPHSSSSPTRPPSPPPSFSPRSPSPPLHKVGGEGSGEEGGLGEASGVVLRESLSGGREEVLKSTIKWLGRVDEALQWWKENKKSTHGWALDEGFLQYLRSNAPLTTSSTSTRSTTSSTPSSFLSLLTTPPSISSIPIPLTSRLLHSTLSFPGAGGRVGMPPTPAIPEWERGAVWTELATFARVPPATLQRAQSLKATSTTLNTIEKAMIALMKQKHSQASPTSTPTTPSSAPLPIPTDSFTYLHGTITPSSTSPTSPPPLPPSTTTPPPLTTLQWDTAVQLSETLSVAEQKEAVHWDVEGEEWRWSIGLRGAEVGMAVGKVMRDGYHRTPISRYDPHTDSLILAFVKPTPKHRYDSSSTSLATYTHSLLPSFQEWRFTTLPPLEAEAKASFLKEQQRRKKIASKIHAHSPEDEPEEEKEAEEKGEEGEEGEEEKKEEGKEGEEGEKAEEGDASSHAIQFSASPSPSSPALGLPAGRDLLSWWDMEEIPPCPQSALIESTESLSLTALNQIKRHTLTMFPADGCSTIRVEEREKVGESDAERWVSIDRRGDHFTLLPTKESSSRGKLVCVLASDEGREGVGSVVRRAEGVGLGTLVVKLEAEEPVDAEEVRMADEARRKEAAKRGKRVKRKKERKTRKPDNRGTVKLSATMEHGLFVSISSTGEITQSYHDKSVAGDTTSSKASSWPHWLREEGRAHTGSRGTVVRYLANGVRCVMFAGGGVSWWIPDGCEARGGVIKPPAADSDASFTGHWHNVAPNGVVTRVWVQSDGKEVEEKLGRTNVWVTEDSASGACVRVRYDPCPVDDPKAPGYVERAKKALEERRARPMPRFARTRATLRATLVQESLREDHAAEHRWLRGGLWSGEEIDQFGTKPGAVQHATKPPIVPPKASEEEEGRESGETGMSSSSASIGGYGALGRVVMVTYSDGRELTIHADGTYVVTHRLPPPPASSSLSSTFVASSSSSTPPASPHATSSSASIPAPLPSSPGSAIPAGLLSHRPAQGPGEGVRVVVAKQRFGTVEVDSWFDHECRRHAQGKGTRVDVSGPRTRSTITLPDATILAADYNVDVTAARNGAVRLLRGDGTAIRAQDGGRVLLKPSTHDGENASKDGDGDGEGKVEEERGEEEAEEGKGEEEEEGNGVMEFELEDWKFSLRDVEGNEFGVDAAGNVRCSLAGAVQVRDGKTGELSTLFPHPSRPLAPRVFLLRGDGTGEMLLHASQWDLLRASAPIQSAGVAMEGAMPLPQGTDEGVPLAAVLLNETTATLSPSLRGAHTDTPPKSPLSTTTQPSLHPFHAVVDIVPAEPEDGMKEELETPTQALTSSGTLPPRSRLILTSLGLPPPSPAASSSSTSAVGWAGIEERDGRVKVRSCLLGWLRPTKRSGYLPSKEDIFGRAAQPTLEQLRRRKRKILRKDPFAAKAFGVIDDDSEPGSKSGGGERGESGASTAIPPPPQPSSPPRSSHPSGPRPLSPAPSAMFSRVVATVPSVVALPPAVAPQSRGGLKWLEVIEWDVPGESARMARKTEEEAWRRWQQGVRKARHRFKVEDATPASVRATERKLGQWVMELRGGRAGLSSEGKEGGEEVEEVEEEEEEEEEWGVEERKREVERRMEERKREVERDEMVGTFMEMDGELGKSGTLRNPGMTLAPPRVGERSVGGEGEGESEMGVEGGEGEGVGGVVDVDATRKEIEASRRMGRVDEAIGSGAFDRGVPDSVSKRLDASLSREERRIAEEEARRLMLASGKRPDFIGPQATASTELPHREGGGEGDGGDGGGDGGGEEFPQPPTSSSSTSPPSSPSLPSSPLQPTPSSAAEPPPVRLAPKVVKFGGVPVGGVLKRTIRIKNVGPPSLRVRVHPRFLSDVVDATMKRTQRVTAELEEDGEGGGSGGESKVRVVLQPGPLARGIPRDMHIYLRAAETPGEFQDAVEVATELGRFRVPLFATILPQTEWAPDMLGKGVKLQEKRG